jgi:hypothetical protein
MDVTTAPASLKIRNKFLIVSPDNCLRPERQLQLTVKILTKIKRLQENALKSNKYIPLTLYPRRASRSISDIPPIHPRFTNVS